MLYVMFCLLGLGAVGTVACWITMASNRNGFPNSEEGRRWARANLWSQVFGWTFIAAIMILGLFGEAFNYWVAEENIRTRVAMDSNLHPKLGELSLTEVEIVDAYCETAGYYGSCVVWYGVARYPGDSGPMEIPVFMTVRSSGYTGEPKPARNGQGRGLVPLPAHSKKQPTLAFPFNIFHFRAHNFRL